LTKHPCKNIDVACRFLAELIKKSNGELVPALVAYRSQSPEIRVDRITNNDLLFSERLRGEFERIVDNPYAGEQKFVFRKFDRRAVAERFIESIKSRAGVTLHLGQDSGKYVLYIVAKDEAEMNEIAEKIMEKTGISRKAD